MLLLWDLKHDRNLAIDEILQLCKKIKINATQKQIKRWREIAEMGK